MAAEKKPVYLKADDLKMLLESLETVEQELCGFGYMTSATIRVEIDDCVVGCVYEDREWRVTVLSL